MKVKKGNSFMVFGMTRVAVQYQSPILIGIVCPAKSHLFNPVINAVIPEPPPNSVNPFEASWNSPRLPIIRTRMTPNIPATLGRRMFEALLPSSDSWAFGLNRCRPERTRLNTTPYAPLADNAKNSGISKLYATSGMIPLKRTSVALINCPK